MFDRIVIPLDGSATAERVLSQVARLLRRHDSEVLLVRAVFVPPSMARIDTAKLEAAELKAAEGYLEGTAERLRSQGIRAKTKVVHGPTADAVLDAAHAEKGTMVALATHGRTGLSRWMLGSVAEKIVRASDLPVLLLHSFRPDEKGGPVPVGDGLTPFRRIIVPMDGSKNAEAVLAAVEPFAKLFESELLIVSVAPAGEPEAGPELEATAARLSKSGLKSRVLRLEGDPAGRILDAAEAESADLIAMTTHGRSGISRWILGSVTERVLRASATPLLIVRSAGDEKPKA
jgi:nucleotide-binding universal stress UspA family protein